MSLRDLREDIRVRLKLIEGERSQLLQRLDFLQESEQHFKRLLMYEDLRSRSDQEAFPFSRTVDSSNHEKSSLTTFLHDALATGGTLSLGELKALAENAGIDFSGKQPGRVLHFALLGMQQGGSVEMVESGVWRLAHKA